MTTKTKSDKTGLWIFLGAGCAASICLISILAAIAIPAFINYIKRSKASEAQAQLRTLKVAFTASCDPATGYQGGPAGPLPAVPNSTKQSPVWSADPGFAYMGFAPLDPVYYSYSLTPSAAGVTLRAQGDLDDDGVLSTFEIQCYADCRCDPPRVTNELE